MRSGFKPSHKPFLDASRRSWQFDTFAWLLRHGGGYRKFLDTTLVLPNEDHFPERGMQGHAGVAALFRQVRDHAGMADWPCTVEPEPSQPASSSSERVPVITYRPGELAPVPMVATFARELAGYLIDTFDEPPPGGAQLRAPAVEVATVFMGFGLFLANSAAGGVRYELNEGELVHALAIFCQLRHIEPESVDRHLNPHLRKYLRLATLDLSQHQKELDRLRSMPALEPEELAERTLPSKPR